MSALSLSPSWSKWEGWTHTMPGEGVCHSCHDHPTLPTSFPAQSLTVYRVLSSRAPHSVNLLADQCENPSRTSRSSMECAQDTRTVSRAKQRSWGEAARDAETPPGRSAVTSGRAEEEHRKAGELIFTQFIESYLNAPPATATLHQSGGEDTHRCRSNRAYRLLACPPPPSDGETKTGGFLQPPLPKHVLRAPLRRSCSWNSFRRTYLEPCRIRVLGYITVLWL